MTRISLGITLLICAAGYAGSQEQPPQLLLGAVRCLAAKQFLPSLKASKLTFGYFLDEKSYAPSKVVYLVNYASAHRSNGLAFAVFLNQSDQPQVFNIQNNASFVLSKSEPIGVSFKSPPLGGTWTQEHLARAIKEIEKQPKFTIAPGDLAVPASLIRCESYTDPHP